MLKQTQHSHSLRKAHCEQTSRSSKEKKFTSLSKLLSGNLISGNGEGKDTKSWPSFRTAIAFAGVSSIHFHTPYCFFAPLPHWSLQSTPYKDSSTVPIPWCDTFWTVFLCFYDRFSQAHLRPQTLVSLPGDGRDDSWKKPELQERERNFNVQGI